MKKRILLVDGMALLFRGFYATSYSGNYMKNEAGIATNGVHQFLKYFLDGVNTFAPSHIICCWDLGSKTFRTELFADYKANRGAPPEELVPQFDLVKDAVTTFDIPNVSAENYEADDVIGSLAHRYSNEAEIIIQTGDYDMLQLVDTNIDVAIMKKGIGNYDVFNQDNFYEKKGLYPTQIIDYKGFTGDSADNYPGIKGIGDKTATKLLHNYGHIEGVLAAIEELPKGVRNKLETDLDMFYLSKQLAAIKCDLPITLDLDIAAKNFEAEVVDQRIKDLGIKFPVISSILRD